MSGIMEKHSQEASDSNHLSSGRENPSPKNCQMAINKEEQKQEQIAMVN